MLKAISFFTGAGGLDIGMHNAGFDIKLCLEIEKLYCNTLTSNHDWNVVQGDIMNYDKNLVYEHAGLESSEEIDLILGGSPCQSFSTAGKRQAFEDVRGQAMLKYADLVNEIQPKFFLLENVKGLLSSALKHRPLKERGDEYPPLTSEELPGSALEFLLKRFGNYDVQVKLINSADFGVAQKRERVFIIGTRNDLGIEYNFPSSTHNEEGTEGKLPWVSFGDILKVSEVKKHTYVEYSEERLKHMKKIPKGGGNWRDLRAYGEDVVKEAMGGAYYSGGGKVGFFRRVKLDEPCPTLLTSPAQKSTNLGHPIEDRPLSVEEYLAIQGFPKDYVIDGSLSQKYAQIGNAVPVKLSKVLGESIKRYLTKPAPVS